MIHQRLDIDLSISITSLAKLRATGAEISVMLPSSPSDMALVEQLREEADQYLSRFARVPTDAIVWQAGESERREVTKIGGIPYREADKLWPLGFSGTPLNFVAQICFADSRDLYPSLPGDVLLIFAGGRNKLSLVNDTPFYEIDWGNSLVFEWISIGNFPLITAAEIPQMPWQLMPCYGILHRTWDYVVPPDITPLESVEDILVLDGSKLGGICPWILERDYVRLDRETGIPGTYLCTLSSVNPHIYLPYTHPITPTSQSMSRVNMNEDWKRRRAVELAEWEHLHSLAFTIADSGLLNFFLDNSGRYVRWTAHCQT